MEPALEEIKEILVVDDEPTIRFFIDEVLREQGLRATVVSGGEAAIELLRARPFALLLTDLRLGGLDGIALAHAAHGLAPEMPIMLMSAVGTIDDALAAIRAGASDFITKPFRATEFMLRVNVNLKGALQAKQIHRLTAQLARREDFEGLVGRSQRMLDVFERIRMVAPTDATVLVTGETGTGKELIAQAIHRHSSRRGKSLVAVHAGAIPETLFESELFGHEKGAFTGAVERKIGKLEAAQGGTIFFDEIGDIPPPAQVKLLRTLQSRSIERLGSNKPIALDVRIVSATNRDLSRAVADGSFREDLFYRLNVVEIRIPPLRERVEDIAPLVEALGERLSAAHGRNPCRFLPSTLAELMRYPWPGNVRQLEHVIEHALVLSRGDVIDRVELPSPTGPIPAVVGGADPTLDFNLPLKDVIEKTVAAIERDYLSRLLTTYNGKINLAVEKSGLNRKSFYIKMKQYGLRKEEFREGE